MVHEILPTKSLDAKYYTSPEIFEQENSSLLLKSWQFACHQSELEATGDYVVIEIAGESIFCIVDKGDTIRAFFNVCQHRAHRLLQGCGNAKLIVCPYHAWTYELSGKLRSGPNIKSVAGLDRNDICLSEIKVENFNGFIFVNLDSNAKSMDEWFPNVRRELREFVPNIDTLKPIKWVEVPENCNWKVSVENYSECYHCPKNHVSFSSGIIKPESYNILPQGKCLRHTTECQNLENMSYKIDFSVPNSENYSSWFLWPLFSFQVYPGNVLNTYHWRPNSVNSVTMWRGWYSEGGESNEDVFKLAQLDRDTTVAEDICIVESVQQGLKSRGYNPGPLVIDPNGGVMSEHSIKTLQQWMKEGISIEK